MENITRTADPAVPARAARASGVLAGCVAADLAAVALFVTAGRFAHDESLSPGGLVDTGWPFAVGIVGGYIGIALTRWPALSLRGGAVIVVKALVIGLVLRYGVARDDTPFAFVATTVLILVALIMGWRLVTLGVMRRAERHEAGAPHDSRDIQPA